LVERFVHSRGSARARGAASSHHPFAKLAELNAHAAEPTLDEVESIVSADFTAFELATNAEVRFEGQRLARLVRGKTLLSPGLKPLLDAFEPGARARIERRLRAQLKDWLAELLEPLQLPVGSQASAALRGLLYQLEQGLGCVARREVGAVLAQLRAEDRQWLKSRDIVLGHQTVFATASLELERLRTRAALSWAFDGVRVEEPELLRQPVWTLGKSNDRAKLLWLGFVALGRVAVRCDRLEAVLSVFGGQQSDGGNAEARRERAQVLLACSREQADLVLQALPKLRRRRKRGRRGRTATPHASAR
jgi:ATP-dependent RNA helicase SUPV3L1/SUV3